MIQIVDRIFAIENAVAYHQFTAIFGPHFLSILFHICTTELATKYMAQFQWDEICHNSKLYNLSPLLDLFSEVALYKCALTILPL